MTERIERQHAAMGTALQALALKDMDPSLLTFAILREGADLGVDVEPLTAALELAAYLHRDDVRSNRKHLPVDQYVTHPFRLVLRLLRYGCRDGGVLCAAALHDTVEDHAADVVALLGETETPGDPLGSPSDERGALDLLATWFGSDVSRLVRAVTNPPQPAGRSDEERHRSYQAHVTRVIADPQVCLVKFADFVDNAGSLPYLADRDRRGRLASKYGPLVPAFRSAFDLHRGSLGLGQEGRERMAEHLASIARQIAPDERSGDTTTSP